MSFYECYSCKKAMPILGELPETCPLCGLANGEVISRSRLEEGMTAGVYFNIDLGTGKRAKKRK